MNLILIGAGPIGVEAAAAAVADEVVDAVVLVIDPDPAARLAACRDFECAGAADLGDMAAHTGGVALVAFSSRIDDTGPVLLEMMDRGLHAVTTCEQAADPASPWRARLDEAARRAGRVIVVAGANPGFAMDRWPLLLVGAARHVRRVEVFRRVDTATRRKPLVAKTGRGLEEGEFRRLSNAGALGHVGLGVSLRLLAEGLSWATGPTVETIEPVLDDSGRVGGLHQTARAVDERGRELALDLTMAWQLDTPGDTVVVEGQPKLRAEIPGGYHGDLGTTAQTVRAMAALSHLPVGVVTPTQMPLHVYGE